MDRNLKLLAHLVQVPALHGTTIEDTDVRIWHGTTNESAWYIDDDRYFPKICHQLQLSPRLFFDDMQTHPTLKPILQSMLSHPQEADFDGKPGDLLDPG